MPTTHRDWEAEPPSNRDRAGPNKLDLAEWNSRDLAGLKYCDRKVLKDEDHAESKCGNFARTKARGDEEAGHVYPAQKDCALHCAAVVSTESPACGTL